MLTYTLTLNKPIAAINIDSIYIKYDTIRTSPTERNNIILDTLHNIIHIKSIVEDQQPDEKEKKKTKSPQLVLGKGAFITIEQDSSKRIEKSIKVRKEEDLGLVSIKIETKTQNYIVQLTTNNNEVLQSLSNIKEHVFKNLEPMEYRLRIIIDENVNGKWDAGNFYKKIEPEKIIPYKSDEGKYSFPLRANWEYGPLLIKF